jgi:hypothetical protein
MGLIADIFGYKYLLTVALISAFIAAAIMLKVQEPRSINRIDGRCAKKKYYSKITF